MKAFTALAVAVLTLLVCFAITSCNNDGHHNGFYVPPEPNPTLVLDCEYEADGVVVVSTHNTIEALLEVIRVADETLLDSLILPAGDGVVYHNACPGVYQYVLSALQVDLPEQICETEVPLEDYPVPQDGKVFVCHKGKTICVSEKALQAHLNHGCVEGPCPQDIDTPKFERKYPCEDGGLTLAE